MKKNYKNNITGEEVEGELVFDDPNRESGGAIMDTYQIPYYEFKITPFRKIIFNNRKDFEHDWKLVGENE